MKREAIEFLERVMYHLRQQMDAKDNAVHEDYRAWSLVMDLKNIHQNAKWAKRYAKEAREARAKSFQRLQDVLETVSRYREKFEAEKNWEAIA